MPLKPALVQQEGNPGHVQANREKALRFAAQALDQGADVILFHEEMLVGYSPHLRELAEPANGPTTQAFQRLLRGSQALIIYGLTERDGDDLYISAPIVSANGLIGNYCSGGSNITDATGELLGEIWDQEGIILAQVFPEKVPSLRRQNPWFRGQRPDLYVYPES